MMTERARRELERAGLFDDDADYGGMVGVAVMELMEVFGEQGHSGFSAAYVADLFVRMVRGETLTPLTTDPAEWVDMSEAMDGNPYWQNARDYEVFSTDGGQTAHRVEPGDKDHRSERVPVPLVTP